MSFSRRHVALNTLCGCTQMFTVRFRRGNYCSSGCTELLGPQTLLTVVSLVALCTDLQRQKSFAFFPAAARAFPGSPLEWYDISLAKATVGCQGSVPCCTGPLLCPADRSPYQGLVILIRALSQSCGDGVFLILRECFCYKIETIQANS